VNGDLRRSTVAGVSGGRRDGDGGHRVNTLG